MSATDAATRSMLKERVEKKYILIIDIEGDEALRVADSLMTELASSDIDMELFIGNPAMTPFVIFKSLDEEGLLDIAVEFYNKIDKG